MKQHRVHPQAALEKIIHYLERGYSPSFLGNISTEIGYSVDSTELMLFHLEDEGRVRELSKDEKKLRGMPVQSVVYGLVKKP